MQVERRSGTTWKEGIVYTQKTKPTPASVDSFLQSIGDPKRRQDCLTLVELMKKASGTEPKMWGTSIVGFGAYHYRYASGHEGDTCVIGFSPRKEALTLYLGWGLEPFQEILQRLGKHKHGKGCLYIRSLEDVDLSALAALLKKAASHRPTHATGTAAGT
jgi:hypothetical protein